MRPMLVGEAASSAVGDGVDAVQREWAATAVGERLKVLRGARHRLAGMGVELAEAISPELARSAADTRVAEILPLLAACKFLEQRAERILRSRRLGRVGRPLWLGGVESEVQRVAMGRVLVIGPGNYPLFLPGVQVLQGLAAGNAVVWKPGRGGQAVAELAAGALYGAGLPRELLRVTDDSTEAGQRELRRGPDKVFFTGSAGTGRTLMRQMAETLTPSVMELSGCDAVVVLRSADVERVVRALVFGMRLNGSSTCMAPRRVLLVDATAERRQRLVGELLAAFRNVKGVVLPVAVGFSLTRLIDRAQREGATMHGMLDELQQPLLMTEVRPEMEIAQADVFAPVLSVIDVEGVEGVRRALEACPFALTATVFGEQEEARRLALQLDAGVVLVNDAIVPTADPRVPFGGRRQSGFGATRGAEGLLEMTAAKTILVRRGGSTRHYEATGREHEGMFDGAIAAMYASGWGERWRGVKKMMTAARGLRR